MVIRDYIKSVFLIILTVNIILFSFLLLRKIFYKLVARKKNKIRAVYEKEILNYIASGNSDLLSSKMCCLTKRVVRELILEYSRLLKDDKKKDLIQFLDRDKMVESIKKKLKSKNRWKKRIGSYEAGEFDISEVSRELIDLVDEDDRELVYIASHALLKVGGHSYICRVLNRCLNEKIIEKSNMLYLIDTIDEDIEGILLNLMDKESIYLRSIALESCGKRQYRGFLSWISESLQSPNKEIRVSTLKGSLYFEDFPYSKYFDLFKRLKDDDEWEVRLFLAKNLAKVDTLESIDILKSLMEDKNWFVRNSAGLALLKKGDDGVLALIDMLDSRDRFAAEKAKELLQRELLQGDLLQSIVHNSALDRFLNKMKFTMLEEIE